MSDAPAVTPEEVSRSMRNGEPLSVLDVRDRDEFEEWRIDGPTVASAQVPHVRFLEASVTGDPGSLVEDLPEPITVVCGHGEASAEVAAMLRDAGIEALNLEGGMRGWARAYASAEVVADGTTVLQYDRPASGCLGYLVVDGDEAVAIDPLRAFADRYVDDAADLGADVVLAVDTHVHADHVSGVRAVADRTGATPVLPAGAADRGLAFDARTVADGDELRVGSAALEAVHLPGHTSEMTGFRLETDGRSVLFGGDLLFPRSLARPDLEDGDEGARDLARRLHGTLTERVFPMPDGTLLLPGHHEPGVPTADSGFYGATVGDLRDRIEVEDDRDAFAERVAADLPPRPANYERIVEANLGNVDLSDDEAFEAELGPNNCAVAVD